jgi:thiamine pyrophosphate-dependent acetolactate synthase large subunit-like protein
MHQQQEGRALAATDLGPIDFAAAARAMGAMGFTVERDDQFADALREALASERAAVIHLIVDRRWVSVDEPAVARDTALAEDDPAVSQDAPQE